MADVSRPSAECRAVCFSSTVQLALHNLMGKKKKLLCAHESNFLLLWRVNEIWGTWKCAELVVSNSALTHRIAGTKLFLRCPTSSCHHFVHRHKSTGFEFSSSTPKEEQSTQTDSTAEGSASTFTLEEILGRNLVHNFSRRPYFHGNAIYSEPH